MVRILVNVGFTKPPRNLLDACAAELGGVLRVDTYQSVLVQRRLTPGAYIFADLDRIPRRDVPAVQALWDQLRASGSAHVMNDPRQVLLRYPLLRALRDEGINDFNVYRMDDDLGAVRFPAFVRYEHDHGGPRTPVIETSAELTQTLARLRRRREWRTGLLVTEIAAAPFEDGLFRKYGALLINGQIIACHLIVSRTWMVKGKVRVVDPRLAEEERRYVVDNPHAAELSRLFALANVDYGRIDYGFVNGRIQVYEINTNPSIIGARPPRHPERMAKRQHLIPQLVDAFHGLARDSTRNADGRSIAVTPRRGLLPGWAYRSVRRGESFWRRFVERPGIR